MGCSPVGGNNPRAIASGLSYVQVDKYDKTFFYHLHNIYTMGCPPVFGDNPQALASGLSYVQVDKHSITIYYHLH